MRRLERADDNIRGLLPHLLQEAGFVNIIERERFGTMLGSLALLSAEKPGTTQA
jgi:hypothetical protein